MNEREAAEQQISELIKAAELEQAATTALELYGKELFRFFRARADDEVEASEIFSEFCEDFWLGLSSFRADSSVRTWAFRVARNALGQYYRHEQRHERRKVPLSAAEEITRVTQWARSETRPYLRTEPKLWVARIREELSESERELLSLHIDHQLTFLQCARVLADDEEMSLDALRTLEKTLRKRYQRLREKIRQLAEEQGVLPRGED